MYMAVIKHSIPLWCCLDLCAIEYNNDLPQINSEKAQYTVQCHVFKPLVPPYFIACEKMFQELKEDIKALKSDVSVIKKGSGHSDIDEIESLFSSLESSASASQPHVSPFQQPALLSPPPAVASATVTAPGLMFRPRANSVPPIYLEPSLADASLGLPASKAQQIRGDLQHLPQQSPFSHQPPFQATSDEALIASAYQPSSTGSGFQSPPLLSPPSHSQPSLNFNMGSLQSQAQAPSHQAPLPIPSCMPIKSAESVIRKYSQYI